MPLSQSPDDSCRVRLQAPAVPDPEMRRRSEESIRTEDCEGPVLDTPVENDPTMEENVTAGSSGGEAICSDRAELIERLKKGEAPQWIPNQSVRDEQE